MQVNKIQFNTYNSAAKNNNVFASKNINYANNKKLCTNYPSNYYLSFGSRKTVNEVYSDYPEQFPVTVKKYIEDGMEKECGKLFAQKMLNSSELRQIQRLAFAELEDCHTTKDIKNRFPDEKYFADLKTLDEVKDDDPIFGTMKLKEQSGEKVLDSSDDITTFIIKKYYLEGKTFKNIKTELEEAVLSEDIKNEINSKVESDSSIYSPLGIKFPNGRTYGVALRYSDPEFQSMISEALKNTWARLTPEEITERIKNLKQSGEKERYSLIDAWNSCVEIRENLSEFLYQNYNDSKYNTDDEIAEVFTGDKMPEQFSRLMIDFWANNPEYKKELGSNIIKAREIYDAEKAKGGEEFEKYKADIRAKSREIKDSVKNLKFKNKNYDFAKSFISEVAKKSNPLYIKNHSSDNDYYNLLYSEFSRRELEIIEYSDTESEEYKQLFPPDTLAKIRKVKESFKFANLKNSQITAVISALSSRNNFSEKEIIEILKNEEKTNEYMGQVLSEIDKEAVENDYDKYKQPLTKAEIEDIMPELSASVAKLPSYNDVDEEKLLTAVKDQGKYMLCIKSEGLLKNIALTLFWREYDKHFNTNYTEALINEFDKERIEQEKANYLADFDYSKYFKNAWNV